MKIYPNFIRQKPFFKKIALIFYLLFFLLLFVFLMDLIVMPIVTRHGKESVVPSVLNLTLEQAKEILKKKGLGLRVMSEKYIPDTPSGVIIFQTPEPEFIIKKGRIIKVVVSKGTKLTTVPDLKGVSLRQAEIMLSEKDLKIGDISWTANDSFPENVVVFSTPSFGAAVPAGLSIHLTVNQISPKGVVIVPNFLGKNLQKVYKLAEDFGLKIGEIKYKVDNSLLPRTVIEQIPKPGAEVERGTEIELVVSMTE